MSRQASEEEDNALLPPCFITPTKVSRNDGACLDAEGIENESDA